MGCRKKRKRVKEKISGSVVGKDRPRAMVGKGSSGMVVWQGPTAAGRRWCMGLVPRQKEKEEREKENVMIIK